MAENTMMVKHDPEQYNMLLPSQSIEQVGPWHSVRKSEVKVNPAADGGEVFKVGSKGYGNNREDVLCLAKPALMKIASAAGISWNWRESGIIGAPSRDYVCYKAVGGIRLADGTWQPLIGTKEIDLTVIEEELREQYTKKANGSCPGDKDEYKGKWVKEKDDEGKEKNKFYLDDAEKPRFIENKTRADLIQWRKNKVARAETGAMHRVIRAALGLKSQYSAQELSKPFLIPRIDFTPDWNNPQVRQALIDHGVSNMTALFGQSSLTANAINAPVIPERPALEAPHYDDAIQAECTVIEDTKPKEPAKVVELHKDPPPAPATTQEQKPQETASNGNGCAHVCQDCGSGVNEKVANYSKANHGGHLLCYGCQKKRGAGNAA